MYIRREEIESWLNLMKIENYVINEDLTVDVKGNVDLSKNSLKEICVKFKIIYGNFDCSVNELTSLEGCPEKIGDNFYCGDNKLISLKGCPEVIKGSFNCGHNELSSLEGGPIIVHGTFFCYNNEIITLKYFPKEIKGKYIYVNKNNIKEEELVNFNCDITNTKKIYSDFNENGDVEEFLGKMNYYKSKKENELLKELSVNSNNVKLNKKL